jgi:hypothetical protein
MDETMTPRDPSQSANAGAEAATGASSTEEELTLEVDLEIDEEPEQARQAPGLEDLLVELESRCATANIETERREFGAGPASWLLIHMPAGRETQPIAVISTERARVILASEFEKLHFLSHYAALANYEEGFIEAAFRGVGSTTGIDAIRRWIGDTGEILLTDPRNRRRTIRIGRLTPALAGFFRGYQTRSRSELSLRVDGFPIGGHDQATSLLQKVSNSLFFAIDGATALA